MLQSNSDETMKKIYRIGRFQFDSYTEYKKGLEDVKKIKYISDEVDINEQGVALRLYTLIRQKDIKFQSVIGEDYLLYLSDLLADDYKELADEGIESLAVDGGSGGFPRKIAGILCIITAILCFGYFFGNEYLDYRKAREVKELQASRETSKAAQYIADYINKNLRGETEEEVEDEEFLAQPGVSMAEQETEPSVEESEPPPILPEYAALHAENPDLAGWIKIPGTEIDYPVMQSLDSNEYYLKHNFEKEEDKNGSIFMDMRNQVLDRDDNLMIYGHNMKSGMMFGSLGEYLDETYWKNHKRIQFHTLYDREEYDIIAVCLAKVEYQDDDVFRYYDFLNAEDEAAFAEYKKNIEELKVYQDELDINYGDKLITLSTCNYYIEDGRLFLVAKKVDGT